MSRLRCKTYILNLEMAHGRYLWLTSNYGYVWPINCMYYVLIVTYVCLKVEMAVAGYSINKTGGHKPAVSG